MDVPKRLALWIIVVPFILQLGAWFFVPDSWFYKNAVESEWGFVEMLSALFLLPAAWYAGKTSAKALKKGLLLLARLLAVYVLGCIFLAGEEVSWGQHVVGWSSPEYFQENNKQNETNLHNLESFNKNVLKWAVVIGIALGGLLSWLQARLARAQGFWSPKRSFIWLVPTTVCFLPALCVFAMHMFGKLLRWNGMDTGGTWGGNYRELSELYIAIFFWFFAWSLHLRFDREDPASGVPA